ncbi:MFS transporter [Agrobacterium tumefaciens]|uniref:MFS transporter n=1 Tax=Agrobacterium tumefaciens TaxID=358 RepID=A0A2L2LMS0_AGRTU|nr:MFS transporter [Agrobacterium tumefaciens]AVH45633.1 MFS transporter [Agrobacterium tumefaciens]NSY99293.1 MFS transporter [Agrobacterium tumefaciens]
MTFLAKWPGPIATISIAQLFGTSLWFSANAATAELMLSWNVGEAEIGWLTSAVQGGFIFGTLILSLTGLADRFKASHIFAFSAVCGAILNLCFAAYASNIGIGVLLRFTVGLTLAGIYPLGMKMIVKWVPEKAGWGLSILVAMLTLGTALPHGLRASAASHQWSTVVGLSSLLALVGAALILVLGDGPGSAKSNTKGLERGSSRLSELKIAFSHSSFRRAALGYFGHMWELYAFWTIVPFLIAQTVTQDPIRVAGLSFLTISSGAVGCVAGGLASRRVASHVIAIANLAVSLACCLVFAFTWQFLTAGMRVTLLMLWGATVIPDSPQFSAMSTRACPPGIVGSALALQNAIGFALTMISILIVTTMVGALGPSSVLMLAVGPIVGLAVLARS